MNEQTEANRRFWDEVVPAHAASDLYDVASFKEGQTTLKSVELEELGDVRGKSLLHLQCHFGLDTLSWAREGAAATGIDFSEQAIETARALAAETGIEARFLVSDVYELPENLDGQFDIVFTSYGVKCWLPDIERWAQVAAHFVKPGGTFYMVEFHPFAGVFDDGPGLTDLRVRYPYFPTDEPMRFEHESTYAAGAKLEHRVTYEWPHTLGDIVTALIDAGLRIEFLHEYPFVTYQFWWPITEFAADGKMRLKYHDGSVPLLFSIRATKAEAGH